MLRSLLLCSLLLAPPLLADTLSIPLGAQGDTRVALPAHGESREAVLQRFGLADEEHPAVGQPPGDDGVRKIQAGIKDGDLVYYIARCSDGHSASVILDHAARRLCAEPRGAARRCEQKWTLAQAAAYACRPPRGE